MVQYVLSIKPEYRQSFTPAAMLGALLKLEGFRVVDGAGFRTITIEGPGEQRQTLAEQLPQVSIRIHRPLGLL